MQQNIDDLAGGAREPVSDAHPLEIRGAALRRGDRELWCGLDLTVAPGELIAVLGPSGSGKTTLLRAILGLERLSEGRIVALGEPVRAAGNRRIGYIPQQRPLPARHRRCAAATSSRLGVDGHRFGLPLPRAATAQRIERPASTRSAPATSPTAPSGCSPAASSSGCASGRRSPTTRDCCCATSR